MSIKFNQVIDRPTTVSKVKAAYGKNLRDLCREKTEDAVQVLVDIMLDTGMPANARVKAAENILDRGYGKPVQYEAPKNPETADIGSMTDEELAEFIAENKAAAQALEDEQEDVVEETGLDADQPELDEYNRAKAAGKVN